MIKRVDIRTWSILGMRGTFGTCLSRLAESNEKICALSADLVNTSGLSKFFDSYPERSYNIGIAEQNMVGIAAGLADEGLIPFASTFSNFAALRSCEQIRHFLGYMGCNVKLVGIGAGYSMELFGNTHYALEDISIIRSIPNVKLFSPADGLELCKCVEYCAGFTGPAYIRLTGTMNHPIVYKEDFDFDSDHATVLREGADVVLFATGSMVRVALDSAKKLVEFGIDCSVVDFCCLSPLDDECVLRYADNRLIVTLEEHRVNGGLGTAVSDLLSSQSGITPPVLKLGVRDAFPKAGTYQYMLQVSGLDVDSVVREVRDALR